MPKIRDEAWKPSSEPNNLSEGNMEAFEALKIFTSFTEKDFDENRNQFNVLDNIELLCLW